MACLALRRKESSRFRTSFSIVERKLHVGSWQDLVAGDGNVAKSRKFVAIATTSKSLQNQICVLAARLGLAFRMKTDRRHQGAQPLHTVNFVGPETLGKIGDWEYSKEGQRERIQSWSEESSHRDMHPCKIREASHRGIQSCSPLQRSTRTSSDPHARVGSRLCPIQVEKKDCSDALKETKRGPSHADNEDREAHR